MLPYLYLLLGLLSLWLLLEIGIRLYLAAPLNTGFYGSIQREAIKHHQRLTGIKVAAGPGWIHLGWIADPDTETYQVDIWDQGHWLPLGKSHYGSYLHKTKIQGKYRVVAIPKDGRSPEMLREATATPAKKTSTVLIPKIAGAWQTLFKPKQHGDYINDHTLYQDGEGSWRLVGITDQSEGDFNHEMYFAVGVSPDFPPSQGMMEVNPIADFGRLAWAPHAIKAHGKYYLFWSPHQLHQMTSDDGIQWENHRVTIPAPFHKFFRDPMVFQVAPDQWLLYTTARGAYFSQIDIYQSFDLQNWQYIRTALGSSWGSERNSPFSSMESPFVVEHQGHYYLSLTYNNDTFFWHGILMLFRVWLNPRSYNNTLVFHADNPYDFGIYRGLKNSPSLLTRLSAHATELIYHPETQQWYLTTAGWPWISTLTSGEVAYAPLAWEPATRG